ncbi:MAG: recombination regulator RecX, partial [Burkholderiales bacterium]
REHSHAELERKLAPHAESMEQLAQVMQQLQAEGWLSNERFVQSLVRRRAPKLGVARIKLELLQHHLTPEQTRTELEHLKQTEYERALALWRRKYEQPAQTDQERARQARFLAGRGFAAEVIRRLLYRAGNDD